MPGEPAETLIGVSAVGIGAVLILAAYKNVSPVDLIRRAVTTGEVDLSKVAPLVSSGPTATWHNPPAVDKALADIAVKDKALSLAIAAELAKFDSSTPYSATKHFFDLMSQARGEGFDSQADVIENYVNNLVQPASTTPNAGGMVTV